MYIYVYIYKYIYIYIKKRNICYFKRNMLEVKYLLF